MAYVRSLLVLLLFAFLAVPCSAGVVTDIRAGNFNGMTRLVIEHQGPITHNFRNDTANDGHVYIELGNATTRLDRISGPMTEAGIVASQVMWVDNPNRVRIILRLQGTRDVATMALRGPDRLVFDFPQSTPHRAVTSAPVTATQQSVVSGPWMRRIIVDPGHGGSDPGAVGRIGNRQVFEKDVALDVSRRLERLLAADPRFDVRMTRSTDVRLSLTDRTRAASRMKGDLFVSIHANAVDGAAAQARARGFEIWTWNRTANRTAAARAMEALENRDPGVNKGNNSILTNMMIDALESQALVSQQVAKAVHARGREHPYLRRHDRGIDSARFKVLEVYDMPSILVELGFMTHPEEVKMLVDPKFQDDWARILYEGIIRYYEQTDPTFPRGMRNVASAR